MAAGITIRGLDEFRGELARLEASTPKALAMATSACAEMGADDARRRVPTRTGRARASVRVKVTAAGATIMGGDSRAPYFPWLDFGGAVGRGHAVRRPYLGDGRYIYFAYQQTKSRYLEVLSKSLRSAVEGAGLEVS